MIAVVTSFGMIGSSTSVLAQARVVASSGGAAASYPEGKNLRKDAILLLGRGDQVTILVDNVRRTFPGPGKYPINRAIQERSSVSILDSILNFITGDSAVASGAARGRAASSRLASESQRKVATRARAAAVRRAESPPPPPPPPSTEVAAILPPPAVSEPSAPEFAHDVPMPEAMPGTAGDPITGTYAYTVTTPVLRSRQFNDIDIAKSENFCMTPTSSLQLWRTSADGPETIKIIRQSDNETIEMTFETREQSKPWPEQFDAEPSGDYAIVNAADEEASLISIISTGIEARNLGELAVAYSRHNCAGQMLALETSLNENGVERASAAIFGTGGQ